MLGIEFPVVIVLSFHRAACKSVVLVISTENSAHQDRGGKDGKRSHILVYEYADHERRIVKAPVPVGSSRLKEGKGVCTLG